MKTANLFLAVLFTTVTPPAVLGEAQTPITLNNGILKVELDRSGLEKIHDTATGKTVVFARDRFSLRVDGRQIDSGGLEPAVNKENDSVATCTFRSGPYTVRAVYELKEGWHFVSRQLFLTGPQGSEMVVEKVQPFDGKVRNEVVEPYRLSGGRYGISLRMKEAPDAETATWGCFLLVQNPYTHVESERSQVSLAYESKMRWQSEYGPFPSDRLCIGTYALTGNTFRADMAYEWRYVQDPDAFLKQGNQIDWAEIQAVTDCARAFLLEDRTESVRVHIGWCENDYQIDRAREADKVEYRRIIDQAAAMGCQYVLYTPSHSRLAPLKECRDAWKWESNLWMNLGQKIRKDEWIPGRDEIPQDIKDILAYAKSKDIRLMAYVYPSLPFMQNPEWTRWRTEQGKKPGGYLTVDTGLRSFQDWFLGKLLGFCEATGCAGFSFDHWWIAYPSDLGNVSSKYQQWYGCRRMLETLRQRKPEIIIDGRQQYYGFGTWTWLAGTYPHPMMSDEQPGSFNAIADLSTDRVNGARQRYIAWRLMTRDFCPVEILPGFITHQTQRGDAERKMRRDHYRTRDWDYLGWKYSLLSSIATAPFNHVVNYIPARDIDEFKFFSDEDKAFFRRWLDFTDENMDYLRNIRPIIGQPMVGRCDGTSAVKGNSGFVFLFNPNYRKMRAEFRLDASIGLEAKGRYLLEELYPVEGKYLAGPGGGPWRHGETASVAMDGTSACVLRIRPFEALTGEPTVFNAPGKAAVSGGTLAMTDVSGPVGETRELSVWCPDEAAQVNSVLVNGKETAYRKRGNAITCHVTFAGAPFSHAQQIGDYDADFNGRVVEETFTIPKRIFEQLRRRKKAWTVEYTDDDKVAPWIDCSRLLLFVQIAEPYPEGQSRRAKPYRKDQVTIEIDGKPVDVREGYNGVYPYVTRTCMGMYADVSHLEPDVRHRVKVTLPEGLRPGQFQGLFFEHVETEYTNQIAD